MCQKGVPQGLCFAVMCRPGLDLKFILGHRDWNVLRVSAVRKPHKALRYFDFDASSYNVSPSQLLGTF